jgi:hypothetical protein
MIMESPPDHSISPYNFDQGMPVVGIVVYTSRPTPRGTGTVRIITPYGSLTVDQILGRQGEMLAADARARIRGEPLPERDPARAIGQTPRTARQRRDQRHRVRDPQVSDLARHLGDRPGRPCSTILASAMRKILPPQKTTLRPMGGSPTTATQCLPRATRCP